MKNINKNIVHVTQKVIIWLFQVFNLGTARSPHEFYSLLRNLEHLRKNRGSKFLVSMLKDTRVVFLNYLAGNPVKIRGVRTTKDGLPVILGDLIPIIRRGFDPALLRLINTVLFCTRALSLGREIDLTPISGPAKQVPRDISKYIPDFWKELGYKPLRSVPRALRWRKFHLTTKVGPNSENDNALWRALCDLLSLPSELESSIRFLGGKKLSGVMDILYDGMLRFPLMEKIPTVSKGRIRTLSGIPDKELKVRVVAIGDYFSQTALLPLHEYLFRVLKKIPQDCTVGQDTGPVKILGKGKYHSFDLVNATDRFPISVIEQVLRGLLPSPYVDAWKTVMVGFPFDYQGSKINYSVGNPMGFYSSWASFAVTHHYVVYYCCRQLGKSWKQVPYVLLGDDIVIADQEVASLYKEVIQDLGVDFSAPKSYISNRMFEFAKRIFVNEVEVSPFPISGLEEVSKKYYLLTQFFIEVEKKGWISFCGVPAMVDLYYQYVLGLPSKFKHKLVKLSTVYERVQRIVRGAENAGELLSSAFGVLGYPLTVSDFVARNVLENIAVELFADSNPVSNLEKLVQENKITLFQLEDELMEIGLLFFPDNYKEFDKFVGALPTTGVVTGIVNAFKDLSKEARGYSTSTNGQWPLLLKAAAFPISRDILSMRSSFLISRTSSKIAKLLDDRAQILLLYDPEELLRTTP
jgi:hypothetical protein